ncbi:MAG: glycosyltransferase family 39 protein, partial [Actinomycetota bacterium]|nr:glycosyltransferase family 39 protein [Actinomycetota bacterium]
MALLRRPDLLATRQRETLAGLETQPPEGVELEASQRRERAAPARARRRDVVPRADLGLLAGLLALTAFVWGRAGGTSFWLDEGIAAGVASHPLRRIPSVLLQDGSPPLYYLLLHVWSSVFGSSNEAAHALSLLFALALVPVGLWAGWSLFGRRTGWMLALVAAINPFLAFYASETRMYSMAALLGLVSVTAFVHAFVFHRRGYLPVFAVAQALLMYTHNWGVLLGVGLAVAAVACFFIRSDRSDRRRVIVDASVAFGAVGLLYLPWVPSLLYQIRQDLQPWGRRADLVWIRTDVATLLGGDAAFAAL